MNESINVLKEIPSKRIFIIGFGATWAILFGLFTTVAYAGLIKDAFYVSIFLLAGIIWPIIVFLHDYMQNLPSIGLRSLTVGKALGWVAILFVVSIISGLILPLWIISMINSQYLEAIEIGGVIYFLFPFIYLLLFGGLWWYFGLSKNVARMIFFLTISLALVLFTYIFLVKIWIRLEYQ